MDRKDQNQSSGRGGGSSENTGNNRQDQMNPNVDLSKQERSRIAGEMGQRPNPVADLKDLGALSGRDDAAGGSGDRMEQENTGETTDK